MYTVWAWNVGGWSKDNFENFMFRELVVQLHECDIFEICETFLRDNDSLFIENFTWAGNNRSSIHPNARRGSGGVGAFIKNEFLSNYTFDADRSLEDILILKLTNRVDGSVIVLFICKNGTNSTIGRFTDFSIGRTPNVASS